MCLWHDDKTNKSNKTKRNFFFFCFFVFSLSFCLTGAKGVTSSVPLGWIHLSNAAHRRTQTQILYAEQWKKSPRNDLVSWLFNIHNTSASMRRQDTEIDANRFWKRWIFLFFFQLILILKFVLSCCWRRTRKNNVGASVCICFFFWFCWCVTLFSLPRGKANTHTHTHLFCFLLHYGRDSTHSRVKHVGAGKKGRARTARCVWATAVNARSGESTIIFKKIK